jgi:hypothetical protein
MNNLTAKRVIKRQYNTIIDEERKIKRFYLWKQMTHYHQNYLLDY